MPKHLLGKTIETKRAIKKRNAARCSTAGIKKCLRCQSKPELRTWAKRSRSYKMKNYAQLCEEINRKAYSNS